MTTVLLITIDCLRADHVGFMGYQRPTTPNLDRLAKEAVVFTKVFATGPRTPESFPGILTSTYPLMHDGACRLTDRHTSIAEVLRKNGYVTGAVHSNPFLSRECGYDRGFTVFDDSTPRLSQVYQLGQRAGTLFTEETRVYRWFRALYRWLRKKAIHRDLDKRAEPYLDSEWINKRAMKHMAESTGKSFFWLHYMDPHLPYLPHESALRLFRDNIPSRAESQSLMSRVRWSPDSLSRSERQLLLDSYDAEIRVVDHHIGELLDHLQAIGLYDQLLIVVTADHGEEFGEHGGFSHATWATDTKDGRSVVKLYDELLHVPLLVRLPEHRWAGLRCSHLTSLVDLAPTILDILSLDRPAGWVGRSLLPVVDEEEPGRYFVLSEYMVKRADSRAPLVACRTEKWKYIHEGVFGRHELYELQDDPQERINLIRNRTDVAEDLASIVSKHILSFDHAELQGSDDDLPGELVERLRALGYLE